MCFIPQWDVSTSPVVLHIILPTPANRGNLRPHSCRALVRKSFVKGLRYALLWVVADFGHGVDKPYYANTWAITREN